MLKLTYVCLDDWHMPVYRDQNGKLWKDVNLGKGEPTLHKSSNNELDGEPDYNINSEYEFITKYEEDPNMFTYMLLARLRSACDYYLGATRFYTNTILHAKSV